MAFWVLTLATSACAPLTDDVFTPIALAPASPLTVVEGSGVVEIPLRLAAPANDRVALGYRVVGAEAQSHCQAPDFEAADGRVEWAPGTVEALVRIWVGDDDLAERDERLELVLESLQEPSSAPVSRVGIVVLDDDRSALLDAQELGVIPEAPHDQSAALQTVLEQAAQLGRAVVLMAPGNYEISSVTLPLGTTLSAHGVHWRRPPLSAADVLSLRLQHEGAADSSASLVEGLTLDGNREQQGPYREHELEAAHLIELQGDAEQGGRARATFERVRLASGTGSGLFIGPTSDVTVCELSASDLWRDALTLNGGQTQLRLRGLDATATQGTGLWLGARVPGYGGSYRIDVEAEDVSVAAGDVEIEAGEGSRVSLRRLTMTEAPFRLEAPNGTVRIEESVLVLGMPGGQHGQWALPHDVEISRTTLVVSESSENDTLTEAPRTFSAVSLSSQSWALGAAAAGTGHLLFSDCRFELSRDVEPNDEVYAIENLDVDASIEIASSQLGAGFAGWFAPACKGCALAN
jgi:hypothetical protein